MAYCLHVQFQSTKVFKNQILIVSYKKISNQLKRSKIYKNCKKNKINKNLKLNKTLK